MWIVCQAGDYMNCQDFSLKNKNLRLSCQLQILQGPLRVKLATNSTMLKQKENDMNKLDKWTTLKIHVTNLQPPDSHTSSVLNQNVTGSGCQELPLLVHICHVGRYLSKLLYNATRTCAHDLEVHRTRSLFKRFPLKLLKLYISWIQNGFSCYLD